MKSVRMKNIPVKIKLFFIVGSIFLTLALAVCLLFSKSSIQNAIKNDKTSSDIILERIANQIDSLYTQMDIAATSITKNPALKSTILNLNTSQEDWSPQYIYQLQQEKTIVTALSNMMFSPVISNVMLYNREKDYFYYSGTYLNDMDYVHEMLSCSDMLNQFQSQSIIYRPPQLNPWLPDGGMVLSVLRNFSDTKTTAGTIVEIQVSSQLLEDICTLDSFHTEKEIVLTDQDGNMLYPFDRDVAVLPPDAVSEVLEQLSEGTQSRYSYACSYSSSQIENTGYTISLLSNNRTLRQQAMEYIFTTLAAVILTLGASLGMLFTLIGRVTRPLNSLIDHVNELSLDNDTKLSLPSDSLNEFEILSTSLNQMVTKLKASIQENYELQIRESNANLAALQAQVDPHFLYNALNSISAASEIYDSVITTKMCQELSSMMRYVTSKKAEVTLIEELTHTKNYLEFMKISNDTNFDYILEVPREMHGLLIPKLSVQPLAENSFRHGFTDTLPPWHFSLTGRIESGSWVIEIEDNGCGFSPEALSGLSVKPVNACELEINGLGLRNTFSRLRLYFGETFSFQVENLRKGCRILLKGGFNND